MWFVSSPTGWRRRRFVASAIPKGYESRPRVWQRQLYQSGNLQRKKAARKLDISAVF